MNQFWINHGHQFLTALLFAIMGGVRFRFECYRNGTKVPKVRFKFYIEGERPYGK